MGCGCLSPGCGAEPCVEYRWDGRRGRGGVDLRTFRFSENMRSRLPISVDTRSFLIKSFALRLVLTSGLLFVASYGVAAEACFRRAGDPFQARARCFDPVSRRGYTRMESATREYLWMGAKLEDVAFDPESDGFQYNKGLVREVPSWAGESPLPVRNRRSFGWPWKWFARDFGDGTLPQGSDPSLFPTAIRPARLAAQLGTSTLVAVGVSIASMARTLVRLRRRHCLFCGYSTFDAVGRCCECGSESYLERG